ncbi:MAG: arginyltransferase [Gammaproteobacteria bacterium]|nr:arginyltransferase [Gammaproteobacteria bacterium]MDH5629206.1 arginyltransferase [Gammaproteobacteria bacterium]
MSTNIKPPKLEFFITPPHACPYLARDDAQTIFLSPEIYPDKKLYSNLINKGFRRSGEHIYQPHCKNCNQCLSIRIPVDEFKFSRSQKRCLKRKSQFTVQTVPAKFTQQYYHLFDKYISLRHRDGEMYPTSTRQFKEFLLSDWLEIQFMDFTDIKTGKLVATAVFDQVDDGLSAFYTFFDPEYEKFSLGKMAILSLIELTKSLGLPYLYLGYWVKDSAKMTYKGEYRPMQCYILDKWIKLL